MEVLFQRFNDTHEDSPSQRSPNEPQQSFPSRGNTPLRDHSPARAYFGIQHTLSETEKRRSKDRRFVLALPILPGRCQPSIVSRDELNYRVRNGNGWTLILISTNYCYPASAGTTIIINLSSRLVNIFSDFRPFRTGDPYRIRTDVNGVRGRCLNHLTNGPLVRLHGLEPGTH